MGKTWLVVHTAANRSDFPSPPCQTVNSTCPALRTSLFAVHELSISYVECCINDYSEIILGFKDV